MGFLGKKKIKEIEAAGEFVMAIMRGVQEYWPSVAQELNQLFHCALWRQVRT